MRNIVLSKQYAKSIKRLSRSGKVNFDTLYKIVAQIRDAKVLDIRRRDHQLHGSLQGYRECHIQGDLLLIYKIDRATDTLILFNFGSHSELF